MTDSMHGVVIASGPSLTQEDVERVRLWRDADPDGRMCIVVNSTFMAAPWANVLYTNDDDWLDVHYGEVKRTFAGAVVCGHHDYAGHGEVFHVPFDRDADGLFSDKHQHIAWGMNSGAAALSFASFIGCKRIIMLGYDQQWTDGKPRWHGRHPSMLQNQKPGFHRWAKWFVQAAIDADLHGIEIVNCSRQTSLTCFPRMELDEALS